MTNEPTVTLPRDVVEDMAARLQNDSLTMLKHQLTGSRDGMGALQNLADTSDEAASTLIDALAQPEQVAGVPDGWKLVPIEPTDEMLTAWMAQRLPTLPDHMACTKIEMWRPAYCAMLSAAPQPPVSEPAEPCVVPDGWQAEAGEAISELLNALVGYEIAHTTQFDQLQRRAAELIAAKDRASNIGQRLLSAAPQPPVSEPVAPAERQEEREPAGWTSWTELTGAKKYKSGGWQFSGAKTVVNNIPLYTHPASSQQHTESTGSELLAVAAGVDLEKIAEECGIGYLMDPDDEFFVGKGLQKLVEKVIAYTLSVKPKN